MSFPGLAPPPPFLQTPGRPSLPWEEWEQTFTVYLLASGAAECPPERRKAILLHCLGAEGQRVFRTLPAGSSAAAPAVQDKPTAATTDVYASALAALRKQFSTSCNVVVERHRFHRRNQHAGESVHDFVAALRQLVSHCSFNSQDEALRDQFVAGVASNRVRERFLLEGSSLSFESAVRIALQFEQAAEELKEFSASVEPVSVRRPHSSRKTSSQPKEHCQQNFSRKASGSRASQGHRPPRRDRDSRSVSPHCFRCGSRNHRASASQCPAQGKKCSFCGVKGHFQRVCNRKRQTQGRVREVDFDDDVLSSGSSEQVLTVQHSARRAIYIKVGVADVSLTFLVDSGSSVSILSEHAFRRHFESVLLLPAPHVTLLDFSKRPISVLGCFQADVQFKGRSAPLLFYIVRQGTCLIGLDGIKALNLRIQGSTLECLHTSVAPPPRVNDPTPSHIPTQSRGQPRQANLPPALAPDFVSLFSPELGLAKRFTHRVKTRQGVQPVISKLRRLPYSLREPVADELRRLLSLDIIEPIDASEWVSPIVVVDKKDGSFRICVDLREPNKAIVPDSFPLPHTEELLHALVGATHFSKLDLACAYHQVLLHPDSRDLTAFITHEGLFRFKRVCFGLASAPAAFQKMMAKILDGCSGVLFYIDDVIVFGKSAEEHLLNLKTVLQKVKDAGLKLNNKCLFDVPELSFLGHKVTAQGIAPLPEKVDSIINTPVPTDVAALRSFLGLVEYYSKFVPRLAEVVEPMRVLLRKNEPFIWSAETDSSFRRVKEMLSSSTVLHMFDPSLPVIVSTDASDCGLGAVLQQQNGHELRTVAFASRSLSPAERKYSVGEREALACIWACERWHTYLWGRHFKIRTDHQALVSLLSSQGRGRRPLRIARWSARLLCYNFTVEYRKGSTNTVADALSRLPAPTSEAELSKEEENVSLVEPASMTKEEFKQAVLNDDCLQTVKSFVCGSWPPQKSVPEEAKPFYSVREELSIVDDLLLRAERLVVPSSLTAQFIAVAHETHPGITRTKARLRELFWWPRMDKQVESAVKNCHICLEADKSAKTSPVPLQPVEWPERPWQKLGLDIVGPLEHAPRNSRFAVTLVDYHSKWPEVYFCSEVTTSTVKEFLTSVFAREGYPEEIVCDNGPQFTSREFITFLQNRAIKLSHSSVYYPQANGQVERLNRTLKNFIQVSLLERRPIRQAVTDYLAIYRCTPQATTGVAPAVLLHGRMPRTRLDVVGFSAPAFAKDPVKELARLRQRVRLQQQSSKEYTDRRRAAKEPKIAVGDFVRVKKPSVRFKGDRAFSSSTEVLAKRGPVSFRLGDGRTWNASKLSRVPERGTSPPSQRSEPPAPQLPVRVPQPDLPPPPSPGSQPPPPGGLQSAAPQSPVPDPQLPGLEPAMLQPPSPGPQPRSPGVPQRSTSSLPSPAVQRPHRPSRERRRPAWLKDYQTD